MRFGKEWELENVLEQLETKYEPYWQKYDEIIKWFLK
jgi:hypothetical protein